MTLTETTASALSPTVPAAAGETVVNAALFGRELLLGTGLDGRPLVADPGSGRAALVSAGAARILACVAGSDSHGAATLLARRTGQPPEVCAQALTDLGARLAEARLLGPVPSDSRRRRIARLFRAVPTVRVVRLHPRSLQSPPARRLSPHAVRLTVWGLLVASLALLPLLLTTSPAPTTGVPWPAWLALLAVLALSNAAHEGAHALACRLLGVAVEEVGIGLWWGCLPFCYVEHRRLSRLHRRGEHALVALVGPATHLLLAATSAALSLLTPGTTAGLLAATATPLLAGAALVNLNPVLPTDGYRALEALSGRVGFRAAAVDTAAAVLLRLPRRGRTPSATERRLHWLYVLGCLAWLLAALSLANHIGHQVLALATAG